jgi:hypothetical protein
MKTILHNTHKQTSKRYPNGYTVDGIVQPLGQLAENIWHLELIENEQPQVTETQMLSMNWEADLESNTYTQTWEVRELTEYELAMMNWDYAEYALRLIAPIELIMQDVGVKMYSWFKINDLPVVNKDGLVYLYCNVILAEHQQVVDSLGDVITIESMPIKVEPKK